MLALDFRNSRVLGPGRSALWSSFSLPAGEQIWLQHCQSYEFAHGS